MAPASSPPGSFDWRETPVSTSLKLPDSPALSAYTVGGLNESVEDRDAPGHPAHLPHVSNQEAIFHISEEHALAPCSHSLTDDVSRSGSLVSPSMFFILPHIFFLKWLPSGHLGTLNSLAADRRQEATGMEGGRGLREEGHRAGTMPPHLLEDGADGNFLPAPSCQG